MRRIREQSLFWEVRSNGQSHCIVHVLISEGVVLAGRASYLAATGFLFLLPPPDRVTNDAEFVSDRRQCFLLRHKCIFAHGGGSERNGQLLPAPKLIESSFIQLTLEIYCHDISLPKLRNGRILKLLSRYNI